MVKTDDEEQLEYIRQWYEMKEKEKEEKLHRKRMRKFHLSRSWWYLKKAVEDLRNGIKRS